MNVEVNYLAVLLAAVSSMVVGAVWYLPAVFGATWSRLSGKKMVDKADGAKAGAAYGITFVASLTTSYVLAHVVFLSNSFFKHSYLRDSLTTAFWLWLGFTAARLLVHDLFEDRPKKLFLLNAGHELFTLMIMALIIGLLGGK